MIATTSNLQQQPQPTSKYFMAQPGGPSPPETYDFAKSNAPRNNASTLMNTSPTARFDSVSLEAQQRVRHIYPPKTPGYVPAVLRPTELSSRPANIPSRPTLPDTPPASKGNSFDSGKSNPLSSSLHSAEWRREVVDFNAVSQQLVGSDQPDSTLLEVTGPPATSHWKPDETSPHCAICQKTFTWYFRRHHCRKCGFVVCGQHSLHQVSLDQNAHFHPNGHMSRACDYCYAEFKRWKKARGDGSSVSEEGSVPATPSLQVPGAFTTSPQQSTAGAEPRSLGFYSNWSTF
jgi:hypothetical protein